MLNGIRQRWITLAFAMLIITAAAIRLCYITRQSLWIDEAFTVNWCSEKFTTMLRRIAGEDRHPPLYCMLSYPIMRIANCASCPFEHARGCEASIRLISAFSGVALILTVAFIGMRVGGIACALLSPCLLVFHPGAVHFSQEARPYMLYAFLSTLSCLLWIDAQRNARASKFIVLCIISSLSLYACYMAFIPWLARVLFAILLGWHKRDASAPRLFAADLAAAVMLLPWLMFVFAHPNVMGTKLSSTSEGFSVVAAFILNDLVGYEYGLSQSPTPILALILVTTITFMISLVWAVQRAVGDVIQSHKPTESVEASLLMLIWLSIHFALLLMTPLLISEFNRWQRILDGIVPLSVVLSNYAAGARGSSASLFQSLKIASARLTVVLLMLLHVFGTYNQFHDSRYFREDWRGAAKFAMAHENEFDIFLLNAPVGSLPFKLYYSGRKRHINVPSLLSEAERKKGGVWLNKLLSKHKRILVIECRRWQVDPGGWLEAQLKRNADTVARWQSSKISATLYRIKDQH